MTREYFCTSGRDPKILVCLAISPPTYTKSVPDVVKAKRLATSGGSSGSLRDDLVLVPEELFE